MEQGPQAIEVGARCTLCFAILFGRGKTGRAQRYRIMRLARFENTGNAEINQKKLPILLDHHVGRFEVTENDWRLLAVQITQHVAQLLCPIENLLYW